MKLGILNQSVTYLDWYCFKKQFFFPFFEGKATLQKKAIPTPISIPIRNSFEKDK
jgi:hypothetical protein